MALRHVRAVQEQASTRDSVGLMILTVIATDIGYNGEPAYTSMRRIADRGGCHYNTVHSWIPKLIESGDLVAERRGRSNYYTLGFDCDNGPELSQKGENSVTIENSIVTPQGYDNQHVTKDEFVTALSQLEGRIVTALSQLGVGIVTAQGCDLSIEGIEGKEGKEVGRASAREATDTEPPKPAPKPVPKPAHIPESLDTPEFRQVWETWRQHRKEIRKKLTPTTEKRQLAKASQYTPEEAAWVINLSIQNGWQGLFWERLVDRNGSGSGVRVDGGMADKFAAIDRVAARFEEAMV